jgi:hypothetical protein
MASLKRNNYEKKKIGHIRTLLKVLRIKLLRKTQPLPLEQRSISAAHFSKQVRIVPKPPRRAAPHPNAGTAHIFPPILAAFSTPPRAAEPAPTRGLPMEAATTKVECRWAPLPVWVPDATAGRF